MNDFFKVQSDTSHTWTSSI